MTETLPERGPTLDTLPSELVHAICAYLSPVDILRLSSTSTHFRALATDDHVWRTLVLSVLHLIPRSAAAADAAPAPAPACSATESWRDQAAFLLPHARFLGFFLSSTPYTSRVIKVSADYSATGALTLSAHQLVPVNQLALPDYTPDPPPRLPFGCILEPSRTSYLVPSTGPGSHTPDAGLSFDLLDPRIDLTPIFTISRTSGTITSTDPTTAGSSRSGTLAQSLRVKLVDVQVEVDTHSSVEETEAEARRRDTQSMYALFTGRFPKIPWPTQELLGTLGRLPNSHRRLGPMIGITEWLFARGEPLPLIQDGKINGFHLQVIRKVPQVTIADQLESDGTSRRRGVGPNGGPAILWNGQERDPAERAVITLLRAGANAGEGPGGVVLHLPQIPTQRVTQDTAMMEEVVSTHQEDFHAIAAPPSPINWETPSPVDDQGDILASSLEGIWIGAYGAHGIEFGHVSIVLEPVEGQPHVFRRILRYVKITGDVNVPSGQISWQADLAPLDRRLSPSYSTSSDPEAYLGTVETVTNAKLLRWAELQPDDLGGEVPDWNLGSYVGTGRLALSGFVQPSWTSSTFTLIRSSHTLTRDVVASDGSGDVRTEKRVLDSVEEIRLRWRELGKVSVFRRLRC